MRPAFGFARVRAIRRANRAGANARPDPGAGARDTRGNRVPLAGQAGGGPDAAIGAVRRVQRGGGANGAERDGGKTCEIWTGAMGPQALRTMTKYDISGGGHDKT